MALTNSYCSKLPRYSSGSIQIRVRHALTGDLLVGELVFELIRIKVEFGNHFIDLLDVRLKAFFGFLYALVPKHGMETFDVLLGEQGVRTELKVGATSLTGQDVSLTFHEGTLNLYYG